MTHDATPPTRYEHRPLDAAKLRWHCDPDQFKFESTSDVKPLEGVVGQDAAVEALRFGLEIDAPGQNIFVRGLSGTGRNTLLTGLLESIKSGSHTAPDRAYVHNFDSPDRPHLLTLPRGKGVAFRRGMDEFIRYLREDLKPALTSDVVKGRIGALDTLMQDRVEEIGKPFDTELKNAELTLVQVQVGESSRPVIVPVVDGEAASPDKIEELRKEGKLSDEAYAKLGEKLTEYNERLQDVGEQIQAIHVERREALRDLMQAETTRVLDSAVAALKSNYPDVGVHTWLDRVVKDVAEERLQEFEEGTNFLRLYEVNLIARHDDSESPPVVVENAPGMSALLGSIDRPFGRDDEAFIPHMMVRGGSLLRADGGYLLLEARDLLSEPGAWRALIRTLRSGRIEMVPPETPMPWRTPIIKPEPIPVRVKVVLLGDAKLYYMLDSMDADFPNLFKVLADFETVIDRTPESLGFYAAAIARLVKTESLVPFGPTAVAQICEHGARIAEQEGKLSVRFGRLADIVRESSFLAGKAGNQLVEGADVAHAIERTKERANLPARRFRERVADGTIRVQTQGQAVGQVNGLAVIQAGPLIYGFPMRITATIGPGTAGAINIEREAQLSGAIHNKSFYILGGLLRYLLRTDHPLAFSASVAFEQSYGGIDGDSASGAEMCCLLSALTDIPLRQDLAMTGAIDQMGNILPIGAVNEKIEGYFDTCRGMCLTCTQGVIIPQTNVGDLMLRPDVVEACRKGEFVVHAVDTIQEALGIFTNRAPGVRGEDGQYPEDSVLGQAVLRAHEYWKMAIRDPHALGTPPVPCGED